VKHREINPGVAVVVFESMILGRHLRRGAGSVGVRAEASLLVPPTPIEKQQSFGALKAS